MRLWLVGLSTGLVVVSGVSAGSQSRDVCPPVTAEPYMLCQVDEAPRATNANRAPKYPVGALYANASGAVRASFVIDSMGRVGGTSIQLQRTGHGWFDDEVRAALRSWRFTPARVGSRSVAVQSAYEFAFTAPPDTLLYQELIVARLDTTRDIPRMDIALEEQDRTAANVSHDGLVAAERIALVAVAPPPPVVRGRARRITVCLTRGSPHNVALWDDSAASLLRRPHRRVLPGSQCPRPYASMIDGPRHRAPKGHIDPYSMHVMRVVPWNESTVLVQIRVSHGTETLIYGCVVKRATPSWQAGCRYPRYLVS